MILTNWSLAPYYRICHSTCVIRRRFDTLLLDHLDLYARLIQTIEMHIKAFKTTTTHRLATHDYKAS
jgi:hypothetical protein